MDASTRGRLLIATPELEDTNFFRTVVLVLEHNDDGALGVVLNRPTPGDLTEPLPAWSEIAADPAVVFVGGPVQPESAIGLARRVDAGETDGFAPLFGDVGTVDLERSPADVRPTVDRVRVFAGYAGWGPKQLDAELAADGWFVVDAHPDDPWSSDPPGLWRRVLKRQPGKLRVFAQFPADPTAN